MTWSLQHMETQSLADRCYTTVRRAIVSGELAAGERLTERGLAARLNVSATPIREAIKRLEREGLLERPGPRTLVVASMTPATVGQVIEARAIVRGALARLAARRATPEQIEELYRMLDESDDMWRLIASRHADGLPIDDHLDRVAGITAAFNRQLHLCADNPLLIRMLEQTEIFNATEMRERTRHAMLSQQIPGGDRWKDDRDVVNAIARKDEESAEQITIDHVQKAMNELLEVLSHPPAKEPVA